MVNDLFMIKNTPSSWKDVRALHVQSLVKHWLKQNLKPTTIMGYMTVIRAFLHDMNCQLENIGNKNLQLHRPLKAKKKMNIQSCIWQAITDPCTYFLMALQIHFGLTFNEAQRLIPNIHVKEHALLITREIAFNSEDRVIPIRHDTQQTILNDLIIHTKGEKSLLQLHGNVHIRYQWHQPMAARNLPTHKNYRYLYAQQMKNALSPTLSNYQLSWLIRDEMGIKSRNTLWLYFNE